MHDFPWFVVPNYAAYAPLDWLLYATFGALGMVVRLSAQSALLRAPDTAANGLRLNSIGELVTACLCAVLIGQNYLVAAAAGAAAPLLVGAFLRWAPAAINGRTGGGDAS